MRHGQEQRLMNNVDLEARLTQYVTAQWALGNRETLKHCVPDSYQEVRRQLFSTLSTSSQLVLLANANAERVCRYLLAV
jgi:hypothetical protein